MSVSHLKSFWDTAFNFHLHSTTHLLFIQGMALLRTLVTSNSLPERLFITFNNDTTCDTVAFCSPRQKNTCTGQLLRSRFYKRQASHHSISTCLYIYEDGMFKSIDLWRVFPTSSSILKTGRIIKRATVMSNWVWISLQSRTLGKRACQIKNVLHKLQVSSIYTSYVMFECSFRLHSIHQY